MKVYGNYFSTCTRKVLLTLAEKNLKADFVSIDLGKGEHKKPEYLAKHPFGVVPYFEHEDISMIESRGICRFLDAQYPNPRLTPINGKARAMMEKWAYLEQSYLEPAAGKLFYQRVMAPLRKQNPDQELIQNSLKASRHFLGLMDEHLRQNVYFAGEEFTLADIFYMPYHDFFSFSQEPTLFFEFPHVAAWWNRVSARPSWQQFEK